jgi:hypothetical protein
VQLPDHPAPSQDETADSKSRESGSAQDSSGGPATPVAPPLSNA